jgi:hypothetical protein
LTVAELRLQGEEADERGPCEPEGLGANRKMSHVAGEEAELTEATTRQKLNDGHKTGDRPRRASRRARRARE